MIKMRYYMTFWVIWQLALTLTPCDTNDIVNDTTVFIRSRQLKEYET